ncbi:hypothetical protein FB460_2040 [Propioniferax innocua]|uniref:Uncharacterized protein n=1 Tax=Propioniferax innocua TaxID=1753 RepID=A0A542ZCV8_9ACTN|nr:hypothetical protein FB460_2040 [Propioniferax innocua]
MNSLSTFDTPQTHKLAIDYGTSWLGWGDNPLEQTPSQNSRSPDDVILVTDRAVLFFTQVTLGDITVHISQDVELPEWLTMEWTHSFDLDLHLHGDLVLDSLDMSMSPRPELGSIEDGIYPVTIRMWGNPDDYDGTVPDSEERVWIHIGPKYPKGEAPCHTDSDGQPSLPPLEAPQTHTLMIDRRTAWLGWGKAPLEDSPSQAMRQSGDVILVTDWAVMFFTQVRAGRITVHISQDVETVDWLVMEWEYSYDLDLHLHGDLVLDSMDMTNSPRPELGSIEDGIYPVTIRMWGDPDDYGKEVVDSEERVWIHIGPRHP